MRACAARWWTRWSAAAKASAAALDADAGLEFEVSQVGAGRGRPAQAAAPQQEPLASSGAITDVVSDRMTPLELTLATDGPVGPGGVATLTLEARTLTDAPNVHIQWFLPEGGELAGGSGGRCPKIGHCRL